MTSNIEAFVGVSTVAEHTRVSTSLVRRWTTRVENPIPHTRLPGGRGVRYRLSEVTTWMQREEKRP